MSDDRIDLGEQTDVGAVRRLLALDGLELIDVGCGPGVIAEALVAAGARVLGVEPDPIQAEKNRRAAPVPGLRFAEGGAERLPVADGSVDGVLFFRSLHHVPMEAMAAALAEAARVVKRDTGFVCVVEPGMDGTHFPMMRPFNDETVVRTRAQAVLAEAGPGLFAERAACRYVQYPRYPDFATLVARFTGQTFRSIGRAQIDTPEVRARFDAAKTSDGDHRFVQPMLLDLFRRPRLG